MDKDLMNFEANFSVLDRYGTNVTDEEYVTDPAIGRDQQIKDLILVLLTPEKSAILIGKPGIGKTAIVEGLAYRIQKNDVPEALQGYTIINIKTASLLGTMPSGESKVQKMIDELKTKEKMILFIDEIHMLIGSTETSSLDFANIFKEGLGRGSIKVIGATTTEEYERYILRDKAFTRRFQKIEVPEPTREETIQIMMGTLPKFEKQTGRKMKYTPFIQERIMSFIVDITSEYKRVFSLGSRYPDVCLTLLKQAFSYTVYDNRPYMDIFDVRKAIENSKNIYPDVIKKELPNFDKMFNDIMLEEKGEKPVEEWRKDGTLTRNELDNNKTQGAQIIDNTSADNNDDGSNRQLKRRNKIDEEEEKLGILENMPEMVDRLELRDSKPVNNIISSKGKRRVAKVGSAAVSTGLKEKLNKTTNSGVLDDLILSSEVDVLKAEQPKENKYTNFVVTDEIRPGVDDQFLLRRPIESNLPPEEAMEEEQIQRYRGNQRRKKNEGRNMWNNDYRPERQDINNQNFDKYQNYFHQNNNQNNENEKRMEMLMGGSNYNQNDMMNNGMNGPMYGPMNNQMGPMNNGPMYGPMNNQMDQMNNGQMYGPMNNQMGPMNNGPMYGPMNNQMDQMNNGPMYGPMNNQMGPMNNGPMYGPMNNQNDMMNNGPMYGPMNNQNDMMNNGPMYGPMNNQMDQMNNGPMYGPMNNQMGPMNNGPIPDLMANPNPEPSIMPQNDLLQPPKNDNNDSFYGAPNQEGSIPGLDNGFSSQGETLFGAPMYSEENNNEPKVEKTVDIYGQLITDDMGLQKTGITNELPPLDNLNNLSNPSPMNQNNNPANSFMGNQALPANNNRNWTFIDGGQQQNMNNGSQLFQKNILDDIPKNKEERSMQAPTNNKDYYEDMKTGDFVNFSDLNKGNVKEEDTNKYMGVQVEENKPQFDLNLENNKEEEDKFDDFYE